MIPRDTEARDVVLVRVGDLVLRYRTGCRAVGIAMPGWMMDGSRVVCLHILILAG